MGVSVVTPRELQVTDDGVYLVGLGARRRLDVLYRRLDEKDLLTATGADHRRIGRGALGAVAKGRVALLNALGNGVGDDKLVYAYVPQMIEYYLGEKPLLANVPTYLCVDPGAARRGPRPARRARAQAGRRLRRNGDRDRPDATRAELADLAATVRADPAAWVAQELVQLSTHPTFANGRLEPRAVDLRAFGCSRARRRKHVEVIPAALTRVAPAGSLIVNSSRGGGAKDTWVLR